jgi:cytoskeletal protein RodZ
MMDHRHLAWFVALIVVAFLWLLLMCYGATIKQQPDAAENPNPTANHPTNHPTNHPSNHSLPPPDDPHQPTSAQHITNHFTNPPPDPPPNRPLPFEIITVSTSH